MVSSEEIVTDGKCEKHFRIGNDNANFLQKIFFCVEKSLLSTIVLLTNYCCTLIVSKMYQVVLFGLSNLILVNAFQLTVLHTNDLHSRFDEVTSRGGDCENGHKCYGGVARIKYVVDQYKKKEDNLIFLNAGDFFQVRILTLLSSFIFKISSYQKEPSARISSLVQTNLWKYKV